MTRTLSPSAQKVQDALKALGYDFTVIESETATKTAEQAAAFAGRLLGQIVKSLIFKGLHSGKPILVLTSGANRVDEARLEPAGRRTDWPRRPGTGAPGHRLRHWRARAHRPPAKDGNLPG